MSGSRTSVTHNSFPTTLAGVTVLANDFPTTEIAAAASSGGSPVTIQTEHAGQIALDRDGQLQLLAAYEIAV